MVDLSFEPIVSKPFKLQEKFAKVGNYWELKDEDNPLGIHRRIQIFDKNGLIAAIYNERGAIYCKSDQHQKAISIYTKAIELNPKDAEAYYNRGIAYAYLGEFAQAKKDLLKVVELNPALRRQKNIKIKQGKLKKLTFFIAYPFLLHFYLYSIFPNSTFIPESSF